METGWLTENETETERVTTGREQAATQSMLTAHNTTTTTTATRTIRKREQAKGTNKAKETLPTHTTINTTPDSTKHELGRACQILEQ